MATPSKRPRQSISLAEKQSIIEASKTKPKTSDLVTHFDKKYVEENSTDPKAMQYCHYFEDFLYQEQINKSVQTQITQFLP